MRNCNWIRFIIFNEISFQLGDERNNVEWFRRNVIQQKKIQNLREKNSDCEIVVWNAGNETTSSASMINWCDRLSCMWRHTNVDQFLSSKTTNNKKKTLLRLLLTSHRPWLVLRALMEPTLTFWSWRHLQ